MRILVIDDAEYNCASARLTLANHDVTVINNVLEAFKILDGRPQFDAVLTDLIMPVGPFRGAMNQSAVPPKAGIPAGLVFAIKAANLGIRAVVCSDGDHQSDWLCSLLDLLTDKFHSAGRRISDSAKRVAFVELGTVALPAVWDEQHRSIVMDQACWDKDVPRIKNWREVMVESGLFPGIESMRFLEMRSA